MKYLLPQQKLYLTLQSANVPYANVFYFCLNQLLKKQLKTSQGNISSQVLYGIKLYFYER